MKVDDIRKDYHKQLDSLYEKGELDEIISLAFEAVKGFSKTEVITKGNENLTINETYRLERILCDLKKNKPIQYILGYSWFYGMKIEVNEHVLIPRPETEELVNLILSQDPALKFPITIMDIGTGSGCIAIALKKNLPQATVYAMDISEEALVVANANSETQNAPIHFIQDNILQPRTPSSLPQTDFDVIVSNPPYVLHSDKSSLQERVIKYEPHVALFADEKDALIYYRAIADYGLQHLRKGGLLFFEIHEEKGNEVHSLLLQKGFTDVEVKKDMNGNDRFVRASN